MARTGSSAEAGGALYAAEVLAVRLRRPYVPALAVQEQPAHHVGPLRHRQQPPASRAERAGVWEGEARAGEGRMRENEEMEVRGEVGSGEERIREETREGERGGEQR